MKSKNNSPSLCFGTRGSVLLLLLLVLVQQYLSADRMAAVKYILRDGRR